MEISDKQRAAEKAADYIKDGMVLGIGSGSTVNFMLRKLAQRMQEEGIRVKGIPASKKSEKLANELGIPLTTFAEYSRVDLAIDGADEIDEQLQLSKGGGGSLVREKMVDIIADYYIVIASADKLVKKLGAFPLPVEVVPFGWQVTEKRLQALGCQTTLRCQEGKPFVSDNGNYIVDCQFKTIDQPAKLHQEIKSLLGVVETGIFANMADEVIISENGNLQSMKR
ncbi:ribose-5-phosphate isomerase RpiA [Oceanobacillus sp. J11TS1]|uniref:ribose-5-phosphate isomerase RpiA n=1 Tax=Oceanobacillus sp. J11TS1 TaxID=2807191 RepID=UPI001B1C25E2|nr:ribose-5-phosphate isomerase RpiA [Oceanobacillus sp. J11TS1]GIO24525.1 ribose-5-phosphate isomerase A [Oceanobacillus sp. J11TS1]